MRNAIIEKLLNIPHQMMHVVNWRVNITILTIGHSFPKCSEFNIRAKKTETKKCNTSIEGKEERLLLILPEASNNFNIIKYTSTTILQWQNITVCVFIFLVTWQMCFLKLETVNCYGVKKQANDKTKFLVKVLNCFHVWKYELLKKRYHKCFKTLSLI